MRKRTTDPTATPKLQLALHTATLPTLSGRPSLPDIKHEVFRSLNGPTAHGDYIAGTIDRRTYLTEHAPDGFTVCVVLDSLGGPYVRIGIDPDNNPGGPRSQTLAVIGGGGLVQLAHDILRYRDAADQTNATELLAMFRQLSEADRAMLTAHTLSVLAARRTETKQ